MGRHTLKENRDDLRAVLDDMGLPPYDHGDGSLHLEHLDKAGDITFDNCYWRRTDTSRQERTVTKFTGEIRAQRRTDTTLIELTREYGATQGFMRKICSTKRWRQLE